MLQQPCERSFVSHPASAAHARTFVADVLHAWEIEDRLDDVLLCVSELATNAIEHGSPDGGQFLVRVQGVRGSGWLRIEVGDQEGGIPAVREAAVDDRQGRGLFLVAALADDWGVAFRRKEGKTVWAEFDAPAPCPDDHDSSPACPESLAVSARLLASLAVWTWIGADGRGDPLGIVLLAHPPARPHGETAEHIEHQMRGLAASFGLGQVGRPLTDIGPRVTLHPGARVLLHPDGTPFGMQVPAHPRLLRLLAERGELALAVGLDPLAYGAPPGEVDQYVDRGLPANRLRLGRAHVAASGPRQWAG